MFKNNKIVFDKMQNFEEKYFSKGYAIGIRELSKRLLSNGLVGSQYLRGDFSDIGSMFKFYYE
jgi:hypothetical protein